MFILCVCFLSICLCEKYYKPVIVQFYIAVLVVCVDFVGLMNKLALQTCSQNGTHLYVGDLM